MTVTPEVKTVNLRTLLLLTVTIKTSFNGEHLGDEPSLQ
jgi:hypothetical protein